MRWHIQGTDATTGQEIELGVNNPDSAQAVQAAIERQIIVSHIRPGPVNSRPRWIMPLTLSLVIALGATAVGLFTQNQSLRGNLDQALAEQSRMTRSIGQAQQTAVNLRDSGTLAKNASTQVSQLAADLAAARSGMSLTEQQLSAAHQQLTSLEVAAQKVPGMEAQLLSLNEKLRDAQKQLQASQTQAARLRTELDLQGRRIETLQNAQPAAPAVAQVPGQATVPVVKADAASSPDAPALPARLADLQAANVALRKSNADLAGQIDKLQQELLLLAARPPQAAAAPPPAIIDPPPSMRWTLNTPYAAAQKFLILHAEANQIASAPAADNLLTTTALMPSHAFKVTLLTDRPRERLYQATLTISLAPDAPPVILADNKIVITEFLRTFAPALKDAAPLFAAAAALADQNENHRQLFLQADTRITLWNNTAGTYTFQITPAQE